VPELRPYAELELVGAGGEPVDLVRTVLSHGLVSLPPMAVDEEAGTLEATIALPSGRPRTIRIERGTRGTAAVLVRGTPPGARNGAALLAAARHILHLDEDLAPFYEVAKTDPDLAWTASGAGRMARSATLFEDVVKTICTTNCAWSATVRMVSAIVGRLGVAAAGAPPDSPHGRAFPTPAAMAAAGEAFYADVARAGYRGRYLVTLAFDVAAGTVDLDALEDPELPDDDVERRLLALPGVGPYAAAHIMTMSLGRYSKLILDSWTRPTYARIVGRRSVTDAAIVRRFRRYGRYAGLAFWLTVTRDWVTDAEAPPEATAPAP
jgi:N-glycosylase/DNA lyase